MKRKFYLGVHADSVLVRLRATKHESAKDYYKLDIYLSCSKVANNLRNTRCHNIKKIPFAAQWTGNVIRVLYVIIINGNQASVFNRLKTTRRQFVWNEFCDTYYPTDRRHTYYPSVVINGRLYDLKISDLPPVPYFPVDSLYEWTDFRSYGLRSATAYVLVFDLSNAAETFRHIKCLREQMAGSRDMRNVPVVVVGNKHDRIHGPVGIPCPAAPSHPPGSFFGAQNIAQSSAFGLPGTSSSLPSPSSQAAQAVAQSGPSHANSLLFHHQQHAIAQQNAIAIAESRERRDIANIVKKHWRCGYVECSAKYNWRVVSVFKELMQAVDAFEGKSTPGSTGGSIGDNVPLVPGGASGKEGIRSFHLSRHQRTPMVVDNLQDALDRNKCQVL
ncbi:hypothetical protein J437_LFUL000471 [Ladona fulva]|uniref:Uncharacterized protein n=1 Tax=Ladona fulva TaxID=123851 RepID=A0A8K0KIW8_LADFU|nr:hypothetical protein J437_LFUL000471 [Ladona fulva]